MWASASRHKTDLTRLLGTLIRTAKYLKPAGILTNPTEANENAGGALRGAGW